MEKSLEEFVAKTELMTHIYRDNMQRVLGLLGRFKTLDFTMPDWKHTPLTLAILRGNFELVKVLIEKRGVNIKTEHMGVPTPLSVALQKGHDDIAKYLIDLGVNISSRSYKGDVPLIEAKSIEIVEYLIDKGADIHATTASYPQSNNLLRALEMSNLIAAKALVFAGADVHFTDKNGLNPLHIATKQNIADVELIRILLMRGVGINEKDGYNNTAIFYCAVSRNTENVEYLLSVGADPNLVNQNSMDLKKALIWDQKLSTLMTQGVATA